MRLLQRNNDGKYSMTEFIGDAIPRYAILSHTWGADYDEVTLADLEKDTGTSKAGYKKLRFCADQAAKHGLRYFWVDTCCIDKSSSQELSEAIVSFFSWYQRAEKCYVYLSDVRNDTSEENNGDVRRWKPAFRTSIWFTRGWTLQELIAPSSLEFFSQEGELLGNKQALEQTIHEITNIPIEALRGAPLSSFNKDERMSWAARRKTKRDEDAAYCLLGIFDVSIPLLYGEGREKAFARLEEQIEKASKGATIPLHVEQRQKLLESLRFNQIEARHLTIKSAHGKTCKWLLSSSDYNAWLDASKLADHHGFLWIKGKPGTGKSTLMKFALANARKAKKKQEVVIAYFFNARGEDLEKSTLGTYRSLLLQLLERLQGLDHIFNSLYLSESSVTVEHQWTIESLKMLLELAVQNLGTWSVVCFIDALDECEEEQVRDMIAFFERIGELALSTGARFRVCFSSRHYPNIVIQRGQTLVLEGHEGHTQDITNYLQSELKIGDSHIARKIRGEVQNKASGVFMWVVLVVDILKLEYGRGRIHALERRLQEIPAGLHDLFQSILRRDSRNKEDLILCIQWVLFAKQPLSPEQLYFAILSGTDPATVSHWDSDVITEDTVKHFILDASKGLTEITKSKSPRVQFIHESVRDFLLKDDGLRSIWPDLGNNFEGQSHECLKRCCLISMSSNTVNHLEVPGSLATASPQDVINARALVSRAFPFLEYATQNVLYHADTAEGAGISQKDFIENFPLDRWVELDNLFEKHKIRRHTDSVNMLYILAERNMSNLIRSYACVRSCFEVGDERYGAPFLAAMATRSQKAVRAFVETLHKDEVQEDAAPKMYAHYCQDKAGRSFLGRDFKYPRHKNMIHFLLDLGNQDVLALAVSTGRVDVNAKSSGGSTPLILAVRYGHKDTVELLLRTSKVDVNAKNNAGLTPLMLAAQNGHKDTVKLLLGTGKADVGAKHDDGWTPLMLAAANGHKDTVKLLLSVDGIDIEAKHINGSTPLMFAAGNGHKDTVELLLGTGKVDVDAKHNKGLTALMRAAANGHKDIVELLHSTGKADPDTEDIHGLTPLMWAERNGHEDTVELLRSVKLNWQALNEG